jgi:hypothetical protein
MNLPIFSKKSTSKLEVNFLDTFCRIFTIKKNNLRTVHYVLGTDNKDVIFIDFHEVYTKKTF